MNVPCSIVTVLLLVFGAANVFAQEMPKPGPELDVFQHDLGTWDVEIKTAQGPATKGKEINRMLGGFWMLTDFRGNMMGLDFKGHGVYGYDAQKKKYVGTWYDSLSSSKMDMVGTYDKAHKTMTYEGTAPGPDGSPADHVFTTHYKDDGSRVMTMHMMAGEKKIKVFEMNYTKAKKP